MQRHRILPLAGALCLAALGLALGGCEDEPDPVGVPFEGVDPNIAQTPPPAPPPPEASASASSTVTPTAPPRATSIDGCCSALRSAAAKALTDGNRKNYNAAADVCIRQKQRIAEGKATRGQALSVIRMSLISAPPGACQ